jgi:hypothetical protein
MEAAVPAGGAKNTIGPALKRELKKGSFIPGTLKRCFPLLKHGFHQVCYGYFASQICCSLNLFESQHQLWNECGAELRPLAAGDLDRC